MSPETYLRRTEFEAFTHNLRAGRVVSAPQAPASGSIIVAGIAGQYLGWDKTMRNIVLPDSDMSNFLSLVWNEERAADQVLNLVTGAADRTVTLQGNPTLADWFDQDVKVASSPAFVSVRIADSDASHHLGLVWNEGRAADQVLNLITGAADRTITLIGNPTLSDWFDQEVKTVSEPRFGAVVLSDPAGVHSLRLAFNQTEAFDVNLDLQADNITGPAAVVYTIRLHNEYLTDSVFIDLDDWFDQGVKIAHTPTFKGLILGANDVAAQTKQTFWAYFDYPTNNLALMAGWITAEGTGTEASGVALDPVYSESIGSDGAGDLQFEGVMGMAEDGTHLYIYDGGNTGGGGNHRIIKRLLSDYSFVAKYGSEGTGVDQFRNGHGVCYLGGRVYIADSDNNRIKVLNAGDLSLVANFGSLGSGDSNFSYPVGICTDGTYLYIGDYGNSRIVKWQVVNPGDAVPTFAFVAKYGHYSESGAGGDEFRSAGWTCSDGTYVYITDSAACRVKKLLCSDLSFVAHVQRPWYSRFTQGITYLDGYLYTAEPPEYFCKLDADTLLPAGEEGNPYTIGTFRRDCGPGILAIQGRLFLSGAGADVKTFMVFTIGSPSTEAGVLRLWVNKLGTITEGANLDSSLNFTAKGSFISEIAIGTAPFQPVSTTMCPNLNADLLDGNHAAYFATADHLHTGIYEPVLGNPATTGWILSSTTAGVRSWIAPAPVGEPPLGNPLVDGYVLSSTIAGARSWVVQGSGEPPLGNPAADGYVLSSTMAGVRSWIAPGTTGGSGEAVEFDVVQALHGLAVGDVVKITGANTYAKALADSAANAEVAGIVSAVADTGNFTLITSGRWVNAAVPALAAGTVLFLSPTVAGAMTATEPTADTQISKPVGIVLENGAGMLVFNWRGFEIGVVDYESPIAAGTSAQYWRGDKTWQALNQAAIAGLTVADSPPFAGLALNKTEVSYKSALPMGSYFQIVQDYVAAPAGNSSAGYYYPWKLTSSVDVNNTYPIAGMCGGVVSLTVQGSGVVESVLGFDISVGNYGTATSLKTLWASGINRGTVSEFFYGFQANIDNSSSSGTGGGVGSLATARAGRFRLSNTTYWSSGDPGVGASITTAEAVYANVENSEVGGSGRGALIGTAVGYQYDLSNTVGGVITNSYGVKLTAPVNAGTIVNHYGLYLADQTVAGSTINWAVYSVGGPWYVGGGLTLNGLTASLPVVTNANKVLSSVTYSALKSSLGIVQSDISDLTLASSPVFATVKLSGLTDGYIPYHVSDAAGLADSAIRSTASSVGIGIAPATYFRLGVADTSVIDAQTWMTSAYISGTWTGIVNGANLGMNGLYIGATSNVDRNGKFASLNGIYCNATLSAGYLVDTLYGLNFVVIANHTSGTVAEASGVYGVVSLGGAGTITKAMGGHFGVSLTAGTITAGYSLWIGSSAGTTRYGLWQDNALDKNFFAGNVGFGQTTFGTSATKTLAVSTGVAPSTSPADAFQMYSSDQRDGNAVPTFRTEDGTVVKLDQSMMKSDAPQFDRRFNRQLELSQSDIIGLRPNTPAMTVSATAPANPSAGDFWLDIS